ALGVVVLEWLPVVGMVRTLPLVLDNADSDSVNRAYLRAQAAAHALLAPGLRVRQQSHRPTEARRKVAQGVGILHRHRRPEEGAQSNEETPNLILQVHD